MYSNKQTTTKPNDAVNEVSLFLKERIRKYLNQNDYYPGYTAVLAKPFRDIRHINYYNFTGIIRDVYNYLYQFEDEGALISDFIYCQQLIDDRNILTWEDAHILIESDRISDTSPEKLKRLLNTIITDEEIKLKFVDLKNKRKKIDNELKNFCNLVKNLSDNIDLGHIIKGTCDIGYSSFTLRQIVIVVIVAHTFIHLLFR